MSPNMYTLLEKLSQATKFCLISIKLLQVRYFIFYVKTWRNPILRFLQGVKLLVACGRVTLKAGNTGVKVQKHSVFFQLD